MDCQESLNGLDLDNELVSDNNIDPVAAIQADIFVDNRKRYLPRVRDLSFGEFKTQALFISGFEKARSKFSMNINCESNDPAAGFTAVR